jgi:hypothetical protein
MKLKSYLKKKENFINTFDELWIHKNELRVTGTETTEEDLTRIYSDKNIHMVSVACWDLLLSEEELNGEIIAIPLADISALPFHHGTKVLNIVIEKETE